ncbi:hypothetical protein IDSA_06430 [Pseudidiomarina salinarum]|uniref:Lipoprotein n=1 Tax=Pseudidiomarina salinarum TaxID=435908 RepID=A0A094ITW0_9GAMM|nr:hypothetical protein [Pseudidiomarina salinarum]KFZ31110.1 hypothetical protein IDSA_06430 [Pseudidiomarina salinarum]RUO71195.1 hypothetical protein CWI79_07125 [Pseudidiomarina salinarum]
MKQLLLAACGALLIAGCANTSEEDIGSGYTRIVNDEGEVTHICSNEHVVGTNFKKRICRSTADIENDREDGRGFVEAYQRSGMTGPTGN